MIILTLFCVIKPILLGVHDMLNHKLTTWAGFACYSRFVVQCDVQKQAYDTAYNF